MGVCMQGNMIALLCKFYQSPSKPTKPVAKMSEQKSCQITREKDIPVKRKMGKKRFFSSVEHQFHALVSRPSIHDPAEGE